MAGFETWAESLAVGGTVSGYTNNTIEGAKAAGYAAWVRNVTGEIPIVRRLPDGRARIELNTEQERKLRRFFDNQIALSLMPGKKPPQVEYEFDTVVRPLVYKYGIPAGIIIFVAGILTGRIF